MAGRPRPRRRLLVLGAGPAQLGLLAAASRRQDVHVIAVDRDPQAPGFALADERAVISSEDEEAVDRLARARDVAGIVSPGADWPVGIAARVAERIGLPHPIDGRTGALATSKARQREAFAAAGVPHARAVDPRGSAVGLPVVVKAPDRQGQRGLTLVRDRAQLEGALAAAASESRTGSVLVEELVDGPEVTVNAFSLGGEFVPLTVTDRLTAEPPAFGVALAHAWPSLHDARAVVDVARAAVEAVGIREGPSYTQLRIGPEGPVVMEVAARLGGGHDAELCAAATGVDLDDLAVRAALGEDASDKLSPAQGRPAPGVGADSTRSASGVASGATRKVSDSKSDTTATPSAVESGATRKVSDSKSETGGAASTVEAQTWSRGALDAGPGGAAVVFLVPPAGRLLDVEGVERAEALDGLRWVRVYRRPGYVFGPLRRGSDRAGAVLAIGRDRAEALERGRRAADAVRFRVDAHPS